MRSPELDAVLEMRTRYLTVVTEDLYQPHNGAAVVRACEGFGIQDIHAICNRNPFLVSPEVAADSGRWVDIYRYDREDLDNTALCLETLRDRGYRIYATSLREGCIDIDAVPLDQPVAMCFGTELKGLSEKAHALADGFVRLPMYGFTQSFNISVSTGLALLSLTTRLRASGLPWQLSDREQAQLRQQWLARRSR